MAYFVTQFSWSLLASSEKKRPLEKLSENHETIHRKKKPGRPSVLDCIKKMTNDPQTEKDVFFTKNIEKIIFTDQPMGLEKYKRAQQILELVRKLEFTDPSNIEYYHLYCELEIIKSDTYLRLTKDETLLELSILKESAENLKIKNTKKHQSKFFTQLVRNIDETIKEFIDLESSVFRDKATTIDQTSELHVSLLKETGPAHEGTRGYEEPERLAKITLPPLWGQTLVENRLLSDTVALRLEEEYLNPTGDKTLQKRLEQVFSGKKKEVGQESWVDQGTYPAIINSTSIVEQEVTQLLGGPRKRAFALIRPPGHHACQCFCHGFCFFNNVKTATEVAKRNFPSPLNIVIIDIDLHDGDGTIKSLEEELSQKDSNYHMLNIFHPQMFPYNGRKVFKDNKELVNLINIPLPNETKKNHYISNLEIGLNQIRKRLNPQLKTLVLISAGFDTSEVDRITRFDRQGFSLLAKDYQEISEKIIEYFPQDKILSILEGGYDPQTLNQSINFFLAGLETKV